MSQAVVRACEPADLEKVALIYAYFVRTSTATFDLEDPPRSHWEAKLNSTAEGDHFLVACEEGDVVGFAYTGSFRPRPAYDRTREISVYVANDEAHRGIGTRLYLALLDLLRLDNVHLVVAVVAQPNQASDALHRRLGFTMMGTLEDVGFKFGAYVSTRWYQLRLP